MKILATINIGTQIMTQTWEFLKGDAESLPRLEIMRLNDGRYVAMQLELDRVQNVQTTDGAAKVYTGTLDITQAIIVSSPPAKK